MPTERPLKVIYLLNEACPYVQFWLTCLQQKPAIGAGFKPVEASDAYEAEQIVQRQYPDAVTASLSDKVTDKGEIRRLLLEWLERI